MTQTNIADLDELIQVFLISNTPGFLHRKFRVSQFVQYLVADSSMNDLANKIAEYLSRDKPSLEETVIGYAAAVALAIKEPNDVKRILAHLPLKKDAWLAELLKLGTTNRWSTNETFKNLPLPKPAVLPSTQPSTANTSVSRISLIPPRPKIEPQTELTRTSTDSQEVKIDHH